MIHTVLYDINGNAVEVDNYWTVKAGVTEDTHALSVSTPEKAHGAWNSETRTGAGTTNLATPVTGGSLLITDLLVSGEKQNSSTIEVLFTDGSATETLFLITQATTPANFSHAFAGRFQGWRNARIDMITVGIADASVTIGYVKVPTGLVFAEWDALR